VVSEKLMNGCKFSAECVAGAATEFRVTEFHR
jgi:hypothetical protein